MKVAVIGRGNVGSQFARIFNVEPIPPRTLEGLPLDADLYIIAVSDSAVADVANKLPKVDGIVVHTTGSVTIEALNAVDCKGYGVFYPFQTISRQRPLPPSSIPLLIEASDDNTKDFIVNVAKEFGFQKIQIADSDKRRKVHLAGTFACNFANAMIAISQKILTECDIEPGIVSPLIGETFEKLKTNRAKDVQTGPAIRKDIPTLKKHIDLLKDLDMAEECAIYSNISSYIINNS